MTPRLSIGLPVYNGERYLPEALDSILAQDFGDFELIISDNASADATQEICEAYAQRDARIRYSRLEENLGGARNHNRLVEMSSCDLFKWCAHDDRMHTALLSRCLEAFDAFESPPAIVHPSAEFIDETGVVIGPDTDRMHAPSDHSFVRALQALQAMHRVAPLYGVMHKEMLKRTRLHGSFVSADYVLLLEMALLGKIIQLEGEPLFQRRIHAGMSTKANPTDQDILRYIDPEAELTMPPRRKLYVEYLRSPVQMSDLGWLEKALCVSTIGSWVLRDRARSS